MSNPFQDSPRLILPIDNDYTRVEVHFGNKKDHLHHKIQHLIVWEGYVDSDDYTHFIDRQSVEIVESLLEIPQTLSLKSQKSNREALLNK